MTRLRGPAPSEPTGESAWPLLNARLFGSSARGGYSATPNPDAPPLDLDAVFGRHAPRTLEIGFNRGRFLTALARRWPDHDHLGIEVRRRFAWGLSNQLGHDPAAPRNVRLIWGDARLVAPAVLGPGALAHLFVTFPDPWWKRKHEKRRLVDTGFAQRLAALLSPGGWVWVKSDVPMIADEIAAALASAPTLGAPEPFEQDALPLTTREEKCLADDLPVVRFRCQRLGDSVSVER